MVVDKTMIVGEQILKKIHNDGVIFCCYNYYHYYYYYDIRYKIYSTLASYEDPMYQKYIDIYLKVAIVTKVTIKYYYYSILIIIVVVTIQDIIISIIIIIIII